MKQLYCPWRSAYAESTNEPKEEFVAPEACVFCKIIAAQYDEHELVIARTDNCMVLMNRYPYNAGHILIIPYAHIPSLHELDPTVRAELMELTSYSTEILNQTLEPDGHNIGINVGKAAGAGIPSHLHIHVLPRWNGDTNFMPTLTDTKQISFNLHEIYRKIKHAWKF